MAKSSKKWYSNFWHRVMHRDEGVYYTEDGMSESHVCQNCGFEYVGQFCPRCSQRADTKKFTFKGVLGNLLDVFDYNNRNVLKTIVELFYRPGYMIRDYVAGHRATYYPPIKLLFFVCVIYTLIFNMDIIEKRIKSAEDYQREMDLSGEVSDSTNLGIHFEAGYKDALDKKDNDSAYDAEKARELLAIGAKLVHSYAEWSRKHLALNTLVSIILLTFFCRLMFRKAPKGSFNLTEHFYTLIYLNCALMIIATLYLLIVRRYNESDTFSGVLPFYIPFIYCVIAYKQLFGYKWIGTIIRFLAAQLLNIIALIVLVILAFAIYMDYIY